MSNKMIENIMTILLCLSLLLSCTVNTNTQNKLQQEQTQSAVFELDTIAEKNTPLQLDFTKYQLFIDTTRNAVFYKDNEKWLKNEITQNSVENELAHLLHTEENIKIDPFPFSTQWLKIRKKATDYLFYDRNDGVEPRYEIRDSILLCYGVHDLTIGLFTKLVELNEHRLEIELLFPYTKKGKTLSKGRLVLERTAHEHICKINIESELFHYSDYVVSRADITHYDLLVNKSIDTKVVEYTAFDSIDIPAYEHKPKNALIPQDGNYAYEIAFAEWNEISFGDKVEVIIRGEYIKIIYLEGNITGLQTGDIVDEGRLLQHKSGQWIISNNKNDIKLEEVGGCTEWPVIDFKRKMYIVC